jgi:hypothetical protein
MRSHEIPNNAGYDIQWSDLHISRKCLHFINHIRTLDLFFQSVNYNRISNMQIEHFYGAHKCDPV